ncbi:MAG: YhfC family intramembrane metalloprotease [Anaerolineales bacterium]
MNSVLIFTYPLGIFLVLALVIGLGVFLTRKYNLSWRLYWIGAALFVIAQILHIPFNIFLDRLFKTGSLPLPPEQYQLIFSAIILGLSAGLFEEITRYVGLRWWAKDARTWPKGVLFGAGWGGMEAIIFFVVTMLLNYVVFTVLRTVDLSTILPPEQQAPLVQGLDLFWNVTWYDSLLGALERMLVLPIQVAMTIIVLQVFLRGQSRWLWLAILWHALLDAVSVYSVRTWGVYTTEGIVAIFTILSLAILFALRGEDPIEEIGDLAVDEAGEIDPLNLPPIEENQETIEATRFSD